MTTDPDPHDANLAAWDAIGESLESPYLEDPTFRAAYEDFCGRLPPDAAVLDLGCGTGVPITKDLLDRGFEVTGLDFSTTMIESARTSCPEATFVRMSMTDIEYRSGFDGVISCYSMLCLRPPEFQVTARAISRALRPAGSFFLALNEAAHGVQPDVTTFTLLGNAMYARAYTEAEVHDAFVRSGMRIDETVRTTIVTEAYGEERMVAFLMSKTTDP